MSFNISSDFFNNMLGTSSNSGTFGLTGILSDYNSIRNGSYLKLAKHYYASDGAKEATQKKFSAQTVTEDKVTRAGAEGAWKDITALRDEAVYKKKEDGSYDTTAIRKKVEQFVDGYNNAVKSAQESGNSNVLRSASGLTAQTKTYARDLEKIGLTVQKDNTIKLDGTVFDQSDMKDVENLFTGDFSFGSRTQSRLLQLASDAGSVVSGMYTAGGVSAATAGSLYDSLF